MHPEESDARVCARDHDSSHPHARLRSTTRANRPALAGKAHRQSQGARCLVANKGCTRSPDSPELNGRHDPRAPALGRRAERYRKGLLGRKSRAVAGVPCAIAGAAVLTAASRCESRRRQSPVRRSRTCRMQAPSRPRRRATLLVKIVASRTAPRPLMRKSRPWRIASPALRAVTVPSPPKGRA